MKLAIEGSPVLEELLQYEADGTKIMVVCEHVLPILICLTQRKWENNKYALGDIVLAVTQLADKVVLDLRGKDRIPPITLYCTVLP